MNRESNLCMNLPCSLFRQLQSYWKLAFLYGLSGEAVYYFEPLPIHIPRLWGYSPMSWLQPSPQTNSLWDSVVATPQWAPVPPRFFAMTFLQQGPFKKMDGWHMLLVTSDNDLSFMISGAEKYLNILKGLPEMLKSTKQNERFTQRTPKKSHFKPQPPRIPEFPTS